MGRTLWSSVQRTCRTLEWLRERYGAWRTESVQVDTSTTMTSSTAACRLTVVLVFICSSWNFADPFQLNDSSSTTGTTYPTIRRNDPAGTTVISGSTALTSYVTPPSSIRSTLQTAGKSHYVSSSGKIDGNRNIVIYEMIGFAPPPIFRCGNAN